MHAQVADACMRSPGAQAMLPLSISASPWSTTLLTPVPRFPAACPCMRSLALSTNNNIACFSLFGNKKRRKKGKGSKKRSAPLGQGAQAGGDTVAGAHGKTAGAPAVSCQKNSHSIIAHGPSGHVPTIAAPPRSPLGPSHQPPHARPGPPHVLHGAGLPQHDVDELPTEELLPAGELGQRTPLHAMGTLCLPAWGMVQA